MYINTLISLQENIPTYGVEGKMVTGHVTIKTPGIIQCYVENLKRTSGRNFELYAFSSKKSSGVRIGELSKDKVTKWLVDEHGVGKSSLELSDIDGVAIVVLEGDTRSVDAILVGFKENRYSMQPILEKVVPAPPKNTKKPGNTANLGSSNNMGNPNNMGNSSSQGSNQWNNNQGTSENTGWNSGQGNSTSSVIQGPGPVIGIDGMPINTNTVVEGEMGVPGIIQDVDEPINTSVDEDSVENLESEPLMDTFEEDGEFERDQTILEDNLDEEEQYWKIETYTKQELNQEEDCVALAENEDTLPQSQEEIDYLAEIEKKLTDIKSRLKHVHDNNKGVDDIVSYSSKERDSMTKEEVVSTENAIDDILNKMRLLKNPSQNKKFQSPQSSQTAKVSNKTQDVLSTIYAQGESVEAFIQEQTDTEWVRIPYSEFLKIPGLKQEWCTQPFITFTFYKYNEILMGKDSDNKYYLGIPDVYNPERKDILKDPVEVERFLCRRNIEPVVGEYGYWVIPL